MILMMSNSEKLAQMQERDAAICRYYQEGHKLSQCASKFQIGRQRVQQILQAAGVWKPYQKSNRTAFLGVTVSESTKAGLKEKAEERGVSVSKFASDTLDEAVKDEAVKDEALKEPA